MKTIILILCLIQLSCSQSNNHEVKQLNEEASKLLKTEDYIGAINLSKNALTLSKKNKDTVNSIESLYMISRASALLGNFENAVTYGEKGAKLCKTTENFQLEYKLNNTLSWAYWSLGTSFSQNLEHQKRQLYVVNQLNDEGAKADVYNNYGYDTTISGSIPLDEAITYSTFANDYYAKTEKNEGRWYSLMNLTWQYRLINDYKQSEYYGKLSAKQAKVDSDRHAIVEANTNIGETLLAQGKLSEAMSYYEEALTWSKQKEDRDKYVFDVYYSKYLWYKGEKNKAVEYVKNAIKFLETGEVFYEMLGRAFLTNYSYELGNFEEVEKQLNVFNNPRSNYFSFEVKAIAKIVEAKLKANVNKVEAIKILDSVSEELNKVGALYLIERVDNVKKTIF